MAGRAKREPFKVWAADRTAEPGLQRPPKLMLPAIPRSDLDGKITPEDVQRWGALLHPDEMRFLRLLAKGYDPGDCAELVGRDREDGDGMRSRLLSTTAGFAFHRMQLAHALSGLMGLAINAVQECLESGDGRVKLAAARTVFEANAFFGNRADARDAMMRSAGVETATATPEELQAQADAFKAEVARLDELARLVREGEAGVVVEGRAEEVKGEGGEPPSPLPWD